MKMGDKVRHRDGRKGVVTYNAAGWADVDFGRDGGKRDWSVIPESQLEVVEDTDDES